MIISIDKSYRAEFDALSRRAHEQVADACESIDGFVRLLRVVDAPSLPSPPVVTSSELWVAVDERAPAYVIAERHWELEVDARKLTTPIERRCHPAQLEPTIVCVQAVVDVRRGKRMQAALEALRLPMIPKDPPYGCDGTMIEVTIGDGVAGCTLWWWVDPPKQWKPLGVLVREVERLASAAVRAAAKTPARSTRD